MCCVDGLSLPVLVMVFLFLATACGASGEPTPTPEPELTLERVLESAGGKLAAMSTAKFEMIDEMESGAQFFRTTLKSVEGEIRSPDAARMLVDVEAPAMGFVEIEILAVKDLAYMKFSKDAPWLSLPIDQVPFNFGGNRHCFERIAAHHPGCSHYGSGVHRGRPDYPYRREYCVRGAFRPHHVRGLGSSNHVDLLDWRS